MFVKKIITVFFLFFLFTLPIYASKVKGSKVYFKKIEISSKKLGKKIDLLSAYMYVSMNDRGSLIKSDFWGLQPSWYIRGLDLNEVTNQYPFSEVWIKKYGIWRRYSDNLVRNINGVIFNPVAISDRWYVDINIAFDFSPGYTNIRRYKEHIINYLHNSGVPQAKIESAFQYFEMKTSAVNDVIEQKVYKKFDTIYKGNTKLGIRKAYENLATQLDKQGKLNLNWWETPLYHSKLFSEKRFNSFGVPLNVVSRKRLNDIIDDDISQLNLFDYYRMRGSHIKIQTSVIYFRVASKMSRSQRYNQLEKLKEMLNKKVSLGKARKLQTSKFTIYRDIKRKNREPGELAINFKTGEGYWKESVSNYEGAFLYVKKSIDKEVVNINKVLKQYFKLVLDETVKKFKQETPQTNDF